MRQGGTWVLHDAAAGSYDAEHDPRVAEALMNNREAKSISEVAATLRAEIIAGRYSGDKARVPSRTEIRDRFGISPESGGVVLRMLTADGLIRMEQGRGTFAEPVQRHRAVVTARRLDGRPADPWAEGIAADLLALGEADLPEAHARADGSAVDITVTVIAGDAGYAAGRAAAAARSVLGGAWKITGTLTGEA
jgi:DNA-binding transcriptional MocR family regulator